jgi:hypothetical protein
MDKEQERYDNLMNLLRRSKPDMGDAGQFSENVIGRIRQERTRLSVTEAVYEFIFGWVYIGWMRRSMIMVATCLMLYFGYQQTVTLKRIESLSLRSVVDVDLMKTGMNSTLPGRWKLYPIFGKRSDEGRIEISEKELDKFIKSVNDLQEQYDDIFRLIEKDPALKKYVDERLKKTGQNKIKI